MLLPFSRYFRAGGRGRGGSEAPKKKVVLCVHRSKPGRNTEQGHGQRRWGDTAIAFGVRRAQGIEIPPAVNETCCGRVNCGWGWGAQRIVYIDQSRLNLAPKMPKKVLGGGQKWSEHSFTGPQASGPSRGLSGVPPEST